MKENDGISEGLRILVFCNPWRLRFTYSRDLLRAWRRFSRHSVCFAPDFSDPPPGERGPLAADYDLNDFDVVVADRSLWVSLGLVSSRLERGLDGYKGFKVLMVNDNQYNTERTRRWIEEREIDFVLTAVPEEYVARAYPPERFPRTRFLSMLPGYAPIDDMLGFFDPLPLAERPLDVVYRGRAPHRWAGALVREKWEIGVRMEAVCREHGLRADIAWGEENRIHGFEWYRFLQSGRTTLGSESGCNVFDEEGRIRAYFEELGGSEEHPVDPASVPPELNFREENLGVQMNQMPPKLFEAAALGTAMVLFEGEYSGILEPERHYIPLRKDFSNIDEVVERIRDTAYLEEMVRRARRDLIESSEYGYDRFIARLEAGIGRAVLEKNGAPARRPLYLREATPPLATLEEMMAEGMRERQARAERFEQQARRYREAARAGGEKLQETRRALRETRHILRQVRQRRDALRAQLREERAQGALKRFWRGVRGGGRRNG